MEPRELETGVFGAAAADVHGLDGLTGGAFHQVVHGSHYDDSVAAGVKLKADVAVVAPAQDLGLGVAVDTARLFHQTDERLPAIGAPVDLPEIPFRDRSVQEDVDGGEDAAYCLD